MSRITLHAPGAEGEMVAKRSEGRQLQHHAERFEAYPYERHYSGVI